MAKVALICYHSNIENLYPKEWIEEYKNSILSQTQDFDIYEMNYGGGSYSVFGNLSKSFSKVTLPTFAHAMNSLISFCFKEGYDYVLNSNVDDYVHNDWAKLTVQALEQGKDIVSCNFSLIDEKGVCSLQHRFHHRDIAFELSRDHNIIAHPAVGYSKRFWESNRYNPHEIPYEDLRLWHRAINKGMKFKILAENLLYHRVHSKAVSYKPQRA